MAFDGIVMAALGKELRDTVCGGVISRIAMPEKDELLITIRNNGNNYRLLVSASASLPLIYLTDENRTSPLTAPAFCMLLRKHIGSGRITDIRQPGLERVMILDIEHRNDLGDMCTRQLIFEMMGKYSNIIFAADDDTIIDSIKRVPSSVSSIREVLPGRKYVFPEELKKKDILTEDEAGFLLTLKECRESIEKALFINYAGISPLIARELCCRAGIDGVMPAQGCTGEAAAGLYACISDLAEQIQNSDFDPAIITRKNEPVEFSAVSLKLYDAPEYETESYTSISSLLEYYYGSRDERARIRQRSADMRKTAVTALERAVRKYELQERQLRDCQGKDIYKVYGDLLNTYGYSLKGGEKSFTCENFYDNGREITIPLDEHKSAKENARRYFDRYSKLRRTEEALGEEIVRTGNDIEHLRSILQAVEMSRTEGDLLQIRGELCDYGYIRRHERRSKNLPKSQPLHFVSSDGYDIFAGKNNYQNEEVTFRMAGGNDWWFHAKGVPGSHVVIKCGDEADIPDRTFEEAASLAAFYSQNRAGEKVEVDYTQRKNLKRVTGASPGFVIYNTYFSMSVRPKEQI